MVAILTPVVLIEVGIPGVHIYVYIVTPKFKYICIAEDLINQPEVQHTSLSCLHVLRQRKGAINMWKRLKRCD